MAERVEGVGEPRNDGAIRQLAIEDGRGGIRSWRGRLLFQLDLQELRRHLGNVTLILHRAELLCVLRELAATAGIRLSAHCIGFEQNKAPGEGSAVGQHLGGR